MKHNPGRKDRRDLINKERNHIKHHATTKPHSIDIGSRLKMMGLSKKGKHHEQRGKTASPDSKSIKVKQAASIANQEPA